VIHPGTPRAGRTAGSQEWVVLLRGRTFRLRDRFAAIRAEPDPQRRRALLDAIDADSRREHDTFTAFVQQVGGRVLRHHWVFHSCTIEIAPERLTDVRLHASAGALWPNEERKPSCALTFNTGTPFAPIGDSRSADNHNIIEAHNLLQHKGSGAVFALFDTGVDLDQTGQNGSGGTLPDPDPHRAFLTGTTSRILAAQQVGTLDCNSPSIDPWCPNSGANRSAKHGTGVAAIAVGQQDPLSYPVPPPTYPRFAEGHAPGAQLVSVSISDSPPLGAPVWPTTLDNVLAAVQVVQDTVLAAGLPLHVLNISYDLWPDPQHPTSLALDLLERDFDVLVVASASNEGDATSASPGFVNGLSVGNVHKWGANPLTTRYPHRLSARGPLLGDGDRYFPDVCATGASIGTSLSTQVWQVRMPMVDDQYLPVPNNPCRSWNSPPTPGPLDVEAYNAAGTSMASPQVSGAASLYRAERLGATALEAKAAILLTTVDPLQYSDTTDTPRDTYTDRNATGVGYTRDDLLARYSLRPTYDNAIGTEVTLTPSTPTAIVTYTGLVGSEHYAVAIAWPRQFPPDFDPVGGEAVEWANVDLTVVTPGDVPQHLARSDSRRNTYEHLVFAAVGSTAQIQVTCVDALTQALPVYVSARKVTPITVTVNTSQVNVTSRHSIPGFVAESAQPASCVLAASDQTVTHVLPGGYAEAYGSRAFTTSALNQSGDPFRGMPIGVNGTSGHIVENIYAPASIPASTSFTVRALALRTWKPFSGCGPAALGITEIWMYSRPVGAQALPSLLFQGATPSTGTNPPTSVATRVAQNLSIPVWDPQWNARGYKTWPIIIPLSTPFTVDPSQALGVWIKFSNQVCTFGTYEVDATEDGTGAGYASWLGPGFWGVTDGLAAVIGLMQGTVGSVTPRLDVYGFPREALTVLFQVRQAAPSTNVVLQFGYTNPNTLIGPCLQLTDLVASFALTTSSMGDASQPFVIPAGLLHQHVFAQASFTSGSTTLRTNGVRLTIGGTVP